MSDINIVININPIETLEVEEIIFDDNNNQ